jgi:hypothetical protein
VAFRARPAGGLGPSSAGRGPHGQLGGGLVPDERSDRVPWRVCGASRPATADLTVIERDA